MSLERPIARGAAAVATLDTLSEPERALVRAVRLWDSGPAGQAAVWGEVARRFGPELGRTWLDGLDRLIALTVAHGRRPLTRRAPGCLAVGSDEAVFAHFVSTAAKGEREDALLIATLLVRADMAPFLLALAQEIGLSLLRSGLRLDGLAQPAPTRH